MKRKKSNLLFNFIAPIYGLFYNYQKNRYNKVINEVKDKINLNRYENIIDIGCGTGALCSVFKSKGLDVTRVDSAIKMINISQNKPENAGIKFLQGNVLEGLPFEDKSFDLSISSYVAHGLKPSERQKMYAEMSRITKSYVIIHDYNDRKSILTSIIEWLEGGNYFSFIKDPEQEMKNCLTDMVNCFEEVTVIPIDPGTNWYVCKTS